MTLFELFSIVLMGIIALFGIGVILGLILVGVKAFTKNDDATPQLEDHVERNDDK